MPTMRMPAIRTRGRGSRHGFLGESPCHVAVRSPKPSRQEEARHDVPPLRRARAPRASRTRPGLRRGRQAAGSGRRRGRRAPAGVRDRPHGRWRRGAVRPRRGRLPLVAQSEHGAARDRTVAAAGRHADHVLEAEACTSTPSASCGQAKASAGRHARAKMAEATRRRTNEMRVLRGREGTATEADREAGHVIPASVTVFRCSPVLDSAPAALDTQIARPLAGSHRP